MKLTIFLLTVTLCNVFASGRSQSVSFTGKEQPLLKVFAAVKQQTGYSVFYNKGLLAKSKPITIIAQDMPLMEFLEAALKGQALIFTIQDKTIVLSEKATLSPVLENLNSEQFMVAAPPKLTGTIRNNKGEVLAGVSIRLKGASTGTATGANGTFTLNNIAEHAVLIISMIGYDPIEVGIRKTGNNYTAYTLNKAQSESLKVIAGENIHLEISLDISTADLNEVVVNTGYQTIKREKMTGAVEVITAKDIANKGFTNIEEALKGTMSGVAVMNVSGKPGAAAQVRIRGINSLTGDVNPIWIIDGMPMQGDLPNIGLAGADLQNSVLTSGIGNIPPDDIESITVLKDAAATAIYGSRAANGVIVVKTKRGRAGKSTFSYQGSLSFDEAPKSKLKMMTGEEKVIFETGLYNDFPHLTNDGRVFKLLGDIDKGKISKAAGMAELERLKGINTNWYDEVFQSAKTTNHVMSLSGGTEKTQYYASINYLTQEGVMPNNKFTRMGSSLKLTHDFNDKIRVFFDVYTNLRTERSSASSVNPLQYATYANPYERLYNDDNTYAYDRSYFPELSNIKDDYRFNFNIMEDLNNNTFNNKNVSNSTNLKIEYKIINSLSFSTQGTFANTSSHGRKELMPGSYSSKLTAWLNPIYQEREIPEELNNGSMQENTGRSQSYTWRNQFEFARNFQEKHFVTAILGQEISDDKSYSFKYYAPEFDPVYGIIGFPDIIGMDPSKFNMATLSSTTEQQRRSVSFFANGSYSYLDKYVVSGSYRKDGVDIIGTNNRFTPLWNISFKYNLHREDFLTNFPFINTLALRGSYGYTGSIDRNAYPFTRLTFGSTTYRYNGEKVPSSIQPANPSIKWQRKQDRSIGLDFSLFNFRINGTANYYNNVTRDLLDRTRIAISTGRDMVTANVASLVNSGWEFSVNTVNLQVKKFRWSTSFNVAFNNNRILETYNKEITSLATVAYSTGGTQRLLVQDMPVSAWYGYEFAGVNPANGNTLAYIDVKDAHDKPIGHPFQDGRYVLNMDTEFSNAALKYLGQAYPPVTGGFGTLFNYDRISLSAQFTFMSGHKINSFISNMGSPFGAGRYNQLATELTRWRQSGDITDVSYYTINTNARTSYFFSNQIEDGSFLKLNNISAGYNLPQNLCNQLRINSARLNFNIQNLATFTKYRGIDPETMGAFGYPSAKKFNVSLNLNF